MARRLRGRWEVREVGPLARKLGAARGSGRSIEVDLVALRRVLRRRPVPGRRELLVGHLAHLLPVDGAILLRCHPVELARRLVRARRGRAAERTANVVCEATDLIRAELIERGRPFAEVDTTGRSPAAVARSVAALLAHPPRAPGRSTVDWLSDPAVTEHLLERRT